MHDMTRAGLCLPCHAPNNAYQEHTYMIFKIMDDIRVWGTVYAYYKLRTSGTSWHRALWHLYVAHTIIAHRKKLEG
jgi:hypothetical protein